ncbi:MAG: hypothetical protein J2P54_06610 [Bradyrhizobiaceae bacterium]|nr:hypothetical protein [Bradyrhizobiaceae bacterium]
MTRRKGEVSSRKIDRDWPYQVAVPADQVAGENYNIKHEFCRVLSLAPRGHSVRRGHTDYVVFCFADPAHAGMFRERFGGEPFDPKDRGRGSHWAQWQKR